jgi:hypothetical protein
VGPDRPGPRPCLVDGRRAARLSDAAGGGAAAGRRALRRPGTRPGPRSRRSDRRPPRSGCRRGTRPTPFVPWRPGGLPGRPGKTFARQGSSPAEAVDPTAWVEWPVGMRARPGAERSPGGWQGRREPPPARSGGLRRTIKGTCGSPPAGRQSGRQLRVGPARGLGITIKGTRGTGPTVGSGIGRLGRAASAPPPACGAASAIRAAGSVTRLRPPGSRCRIPSSTDRPARPHGPNGPVRAGPRPGRVVARGRRAHEVRARRPRACPPATPHPEEHRS